MGRQSWLVNTGPSVNVGVRAIFLGKLWLCPRREINFPTCCFPRNEECPSPSGTITWRSLLTHSKEIGEACTVNLSGHARSVIPQSQDSKGAEPAAEPFVRGAD
eukprot:7195292-Heterocapsa_arctica.AAC.1